MALTRKDKTDLIFKEIRSKKGQPLVVSELLESLMDVWGGPRQFANAFFTEFGRGQPGGMVRARMLSDVVRLFVTHTASLKGPATPVEGMTDADLKAALQELIHEPTP